MNDCNKWQIITAPDPKAAEPIGAPEALEYDGEQLVQDIRNTLSQRGSMTIRGLSQIFKKLDSNKNRQLDPSELADGLRHFGINLNDSQIDALLKYFDKDGSKTVNFNEFLTTLRVST